MNTISWIIAYLLVGVVNYLMYSPILTGTERNDPAIFILTILLWPLNVVLSIFFIIEELIKYNKQREEELTMSQCCKSVKPTLAFKMLSEEAILPAYQTQGAAGFDLATPEGFFIFPDQRKLIKLGWAVAVPEGYEMQIRPRSGLALEMGISLTNSPGTIDSDYRGEVGIILESRHYMRVGFKRGDRIAQAVIAPITKCDIAIVDSLSETERGAGGFGHTGV